MSNFDTVDNIIQQSIDTIYQISIVLSSTNNTFKEYADNLSELKNEYGKITTNLLLADSVESKNNDQTKLLLNFYNEIDRLNIPNKINDVVDLINNIDEKSIQLINPLLAKFNKLPKYESLERPTEDIMRCNICHEIVSINQSNNEFECVCGIVTNLEGSAYEEQSYIDGQQSASHKTNYVKASHTLKWLMQSQARENFDFPDGIIQRVKKQFLVESIYDIRQVNCASMRKCLKALGLTEYNTHIPLLIKATTEKMPFQLTTFEFDSIIKDAVEVLEIIEEIEDGNSPYHPYLLMKIVEQRLPERSRIEKYRKANIMLYFHIQTENTLKEKDLLWKNVCEYKSGYTYQATNIDRYKVWL
jgi:hypothetical protein